VTGVNTESEIGTATSENPRVGEWARDVRRGRVGVVVRRTGPYVRLRPVGGGAEWEARPGDLRPAAASDALRPAVREANKWSRRGR
jgi:hypothetical protein